MKMSLFIIPPLLCLLTGYYLAFISFFWGKLKRERIYLVLICIWWTLLSYVVLYGHVENDPARIMIFQRVIHSLFVFNPVVYVLFYQISVGNINKASIYVLSAVSFIFLYFVNTDLYFNGLNFYSWGVIPRTGIMFRVFALYGSILLIYILVGYIIRIKSEENHVIRLKYGYNIAAFLLSGIFLFSNILPMNGIDFYPLSNLMFIPLGILTYGILKYRLLTISNVLPMFVFWLVFSSMIMVPNTFIFLEIKNNFNRLNTFSLMIVFMIWYFANFYYSRKIQPLINQVFNRRHYNLSKMKKEFIDDIAGLKSLEELVMTMTLMLRKALHIEEASLYIRRGYTGRFVNSSMETLDIDRETEELFHTGELFEKSQIESEQVMTDGSIKLLLALSQSKSEYILPLIHKGEIIALLALRHKLDRKRFRQSEIEFLTAIGSYATIALANSVMYQNLSDIKDNLERIVEERTAVIEKQKSDIESDVELARKIQKSLLPAVIPDLNRLELAFKYEPIMAVGGDFIDYHYREGMNEFGIFICDVSGHGTSSAMIAAMIKMSLNAWGKFINRPSGIFSKIRELLKGKIGDNFITAFICTIDLETGIIKSSCAGHPAMIIIRKNSNIEKVKPAGMVIFDMMESEYEERTDRLYPGDKIVLYTDGVFEACDSEGRMIGEERFYRMLADNGSFSATELCDRIYGEIFTCEGYCIDDDVALLVAEYKG